MTVYELLLRVVWMHLMDVFNTICIGVRSLICELWEDGIRWMRHESDMIERCDILPIWRLWLCGPLSLWWRTDMWIGNENNNERKEAKDESVLSWEGRIQLAKEPAGIKKNRKSEPKIRRNEWVKYWFPCDDSRHVNEKVFNSRKNRQEWKRIENRNQEKMKDQQ